MNNEDIACKYLRVFLVCILALAATLAGTGCAGGGSTQASGGPPPPPSPSPTPAPAPSPTPTPTPSLAASPSSLNFGNVALNTKVSQTVKITNPGSSSVNVTQDSLSGSGLSTGLTAPFSLGAGQSVNAQISFLPTAAGQVSGSLALSSNGATVLTISISGDGVTPQAHSVAISWNASTSSGVQGYNVYRASVSGGPYTKISPALTSNTLTYTDGSPSSGQKYFYIVTAVNGTGVESLASNEVAVTIPTP